MNYETFSACVIRLFAAYQFYQVIDDISEVFIKQATVPGFDQYHFYSLWIGTRIFLGLIFFVLAVPLRKRIAKGL